MIEITRALAAQFRAVFRRLASMSNRYVSFETGKHGLRVRLHQSEILAEYQQPGELAEEGIVLPLTALSDFAGKSSESVILATTEPGRVQASWLDRSLPQMRDYDAGDKTKLPTYPARPESTRPMEPTLLAQRG